MTTYNTLILCLGALAVAAANPTPKKEQPQQQQSQEYDYADYQDSSAQQNQEQAESVNHYDNYIADVKAAASGGHAKKGYSVGSGLRNIAQQSANGAKTALGNQNAAGHQAAYVAKNRLAQNANLLVGTANAALAGKQVILAGLQQQVRDAKVGLQGEEMQLLQAKRAAQTAQNAANQAMHQVQVIQAALNAAQATSQNANEAAGQTAGEMAAQTAMVGSARQRLATLQEQLHGVTIDFEATRDAALKAQAAAMAAQSNAAEAAAKAAAAGLSVGHGGHGHHDDEGIAYDDYPAAVADNNQHPGFGYQQQTNYHH